MSERTKQTDPKTPNYTVRRAIVGLGLAGAVVAAGGGILALAEQGHDAVTQPDAAELQRNAQILSGDASHHVSMFGSLHLKSGVKLRLGPQRVDGAISQSPSNVVETVGSKGLNVASAVSVGDYIAFERPVSEEQAMQEVPQTLEQRAERLLFVNRAELQSEDPSLIDMQSGVAGTAEFSATSTGTTFQYVDSTAPIEHALASYVPTA